VSKRTSLFYIIPFGAFLLYLRTLAPSVATLFDDSLEFHVVIPLLGVPHPPGYPLYTLLGKLWILLIPLRDPAWRLNLLSALAASLSLYLLYRLTYILVPLPRPSYCSPWPPPSGARLPLPRSTRYTWPSVPPSST